MAAPSKLNKELINKFALEVEEGLPFCYCCDLLYIHKGSFQNWMKQGEYDFANGVESLEREFFSAIKNAYASYVKISKKAIRKGEPGWQGQAWWLERTNTMFVLNKDDSAESETVIVNPNVKPNIKK